MDFYVVMGRAGYRVARRKHAVGRVGHPHRVTKDETIAWFKKKFDGRRVSWTGYPPFLLIVLYSQASFSTAECCNSPVH